MRPHRNALIGSLAAGLAAALSLAALAVWQRTPAERIEAPNEEAARSLEPVRRPATDILTEILEALRGVRADSTRDVLDSLRARFDRLGGSIADDPTSQQRHAAALDAFGNAYLALGDFSEALRLYRDGLDIRERRAAAERGNKEAQHELSISFFNVGEALRAQGYLDDALDAHNDSLEIRERLVAAEPGHAQRQHDLAVSYEVVGGLLETQGKLTMALINYRSSRTVQNRLTSFEPDAWQRDMSPLFERIGGLAYKFILNRDFKLALQCADDAIARLPDLAWLQAHRAHALMFLDRIDEARSVYVRYRGVHRVVGGKSWDDAVLGEFAEMRQAGLTHPLMDEIEKLFATAP